MSFSDAGPNGKLPPEKKPSVDSEPNVEKSPSTNSDEDEISEADKQEEMEELYHDRFQATNSDQHHPRNMPLCPETFGNYVSLAEPVVEQSKDDDKSQLTAAEFFKTKTVNFCRDTLCVCGQKPCIRMRYCGLANLGFTCYSNSVLQLMYQTPLLRDYFTKANSERGPFHRLLNRLFDHMEHKAKKHEKSNKFASVKPQEFNEEFRKIKPDFESGRQHDAQEFMTILIEMVHQEANQAKKRDLSAPMLEPKNAQEAWEDHLAHADNSYLASVLMGQVESTLSCLTCGNKSLSWSAFWQLAMHIPPEEPKSPTFSGASAMENEKPTMSLLDCIREFTANETLGDDAAPFCSKCAKRRSATKSQSICRVPPLLLFHLKRFTATGSKIHRQVAITDQLQLGGEQFQLHGVILHKGDETTGHYVTMVRQSDQHWACFDDIEIHDEMRSEHAHEFEMQRFAYLCLYKKM